MKKDSRGWYGEPRRHALAAKGVRTGSKDYRKDARMVVGGVDMETMRPMRDTFNLGDTYYDLELRAEMGEASIYAEHGVDEKVVDEVLNVMEELPEPMRPKNRILLLEGPVPPDLSYLPSDTAAYMHGSGSYMVIFNAGKDDVERGLPRIRNNLIHELAHQWEYGLRDRAVEYEKKAMRDREYVRRATELGEKYGEESRRRYAELSDWKREEERKVWEAGYKRPSTREKKLKRIEETFEEENMRIDREYGELEGMPGSLKYRSTVDALIEYSEDRDPVVHNYLQFARETVANRDSKVSFYADIASIMDRSSVVAENFAEAMRVHYGTDDYDKKVMMEKDVYKYAERLIELEGGGG